MARFAKLACLLLLAGAMPAQAELEPETLTVESLPEVMQPHWVWVNDVSFDRMLDGRAYLLDADTGRMLGMISSGYAHSSLLLTPDGKGFATVSTYFSRGTRGERTDVATFYKTKDLAAGSEVILPPKRFNGMPFISAQPVMPGGKFALIYNFTPEQSVTVVDLAGQKLVGEFATSGCGLIYPTSPSKFFLICSDGALQAASLDSAGKVTLGGTTKQLFAPGDPVSEKGVWTGKQWLFFSFSGKVHVIDQQGDLPKVTKTWSLSGKGEEGWRPGALQTAAYHRGTDRLYVLMHEGGVNTHKDPGTEIWVYEASKGKRIQRIKLDKMAMSVAVSQDEKPLLYTTMFEEKELKVYDAMSGELLRKIEGLGSTMTVIQPAPVAGR